MGVGHDTVERAAKFTKGVDAIASVDPEAKQAILSGKSGMTMTAVAEMAKLLAKIAPTYIAYKLEGSLLRNVLG